MGVFSSGQFFGAFLGGLLGGFIAQQGNAHGVFAAVACVGVIWLLIAWHMQIPPKSKIISLEVSLLNDEQAEDIADKLVMLPGVLEATVVTDENRSYLKIEDKNFDLNQAKQMLGLQ